MNAKAEVMNALPWSSACLHPTAKLLTRTVLEQTGRIIYAIGTSADNVNSFL